MKSPESEGRVVDPERVLETRNWIRRAMRMALLPYFVISVVTLFLNAIFGYLVFSLIVPTVESLTHTTFLGGVVEHIPPLADLMTVREEPPIFRFLRIANPEVEPIVLDQDGRAVFPKIYEGKFQVPLQLLENGLEKPIDNQPRFGPDSRNAERKLPYLVHQLRIPQKGYLYLLIRNRYFAESITLKSFLEFLEVVILRLIPGVCLLFASGLLLGRYMTSSFRKILRMIEWRLDGAKRQEDFPLYSAGRSAEWSPETDIDILGMRIERLTRDVLAQEERAIRQAERRQSLLLGIVHDVRSPLSGLRAAIDMWSHSLGGKSEALKVSLLDTIQSGVSTLYRLSSALREASGVEAPAVQIRTREANLVAILATVVSQLRSTASSNGILLELEAVDKNAMLPPTEVFVFCDAEAIERIVINLVSNSLRYTPPQGKVLVRITKEARGVSFAVIDTGKGIPQDELPRIFDPFFRGQNSEGKPGAGIGLSTVKQLVELHGGEIRADSVLGKGTTITAFLPANTDPQQQGETQQSIEPVKKIKTANKDLTVWFQSILIPLLLFVFLPEHVSFVSTVSFASLGIFSMLVLLHWKGLWQGLLAVIPSLLLLWDWSSEVTRPYYPLTAFALGSIMGILYKSLRKLDKANLQSVILFTILGVPSTAAGCLVMHVTWEEELAKPMASEREYSDLVVRELQEIFRQIFEIKGPKESIVPIFGFYQLFRNLNPKVMYIFERFDIASKAPEEIHAIGFPLQFILDTDKEVEWMRKYASLPPFALRVVAKPRVPVFTHASFESVLGQERLSLLFHGTQYRGAFSSNITGFDMVFVAGSILFGTLVILGLVRSGLRPLESLIADMNQEILTLSRQDAGDSEKREDQLPGTTAAQDLRQEKHPNPVIRELQLLIADASEAKRQADSEDSDLRRLAYLSAINAQSFADLVTERISEFSVEVPKRGIAQLENLIQGQIRLTDALFRLAHARAGDLSRTSESFLCSEIVEAVVDDVVFLADIRGVSLDYKNAAEVLVNGVKDLWGAAFYALVTGFLELLSRGDTLDFDFDAENNVIILRQECSLREEKEKTDEQAELRQEFSRANLGLIIADELFTLNSISIKTGRTAEGQLYIFVYLPGK